ncbi:MAG: V-type ATPase subunit [Anaerolineaceae bacterium]|nr:V-type ATPase subunit [Anaerolineaceae bacterium]
MAFSQVTTYATLHAKVRAKLSKQFSDQTWLMLYAAPDCNALIDALRDSVYGEHIQQVETGDLTPRRVVFELKKNLTDAYLTILPYTTEELKRVLSEMLRLYEVDNLKATIRGIIIGESWDRVRHTLFPLDRFSSLPYEAMMNANNLTDAVELLKGTVYYSALSNALVRYNQENNLFVLEVALDLDYWNRLWKDIQRLPANDRVPVRQVVGTILDMNNLLWVLRYRLFHQLSEEEIINYTLPFGYRVRDDQIRMIAAGGDIPHVLSEIYPDLPNPNTIMEQPARNLPMLEHWLMKHAIQVCQSLFAGYPFNGGLPVAYLHLLSVEIQDLTVLVEAKSMQIPYHRFKKFLMMDHSQTDMMIETENR